MPVTTVLDESAMQAELQKAGGKLVVVDFTATWCGPCQQMAPFFEDLSRKYSARTVFLKVDVDENSEIAMQYEVTSMPTFILLRKGEELDRVLGANPSGLESRIQEWIAEDESRTTMMLEASSLGERSSLTTTRDIEGNSSSSKRSNNMALSNFRASNPGVVVTTPPSGRIESDRMPGGERTSGGVSNQFPNLDISQLNPAQLQNLQLQLTSILAHIASTTRPESNGGGGAQGNMSGRTLRGEERGENEREISPRARKSSHKLGGKDKEGKGAPASGESHKTSRKRSTHRSRSIHRGSESKAAASITGSKSGKSEGESQAQKLVKLKKKLPTSTVQIRLADGTKLMATFNLSHPVSKIREFINNARPETSSQPFTLNTVFPSREITNEEQTIQEAKLSNSVVVQRWASPPE